jgi:hypothetical protein
VNGGSPETEEILLSQDFGPAEIIQYTFINKFDLSVQGDYEFRVSVTYSGDDDSSNDTLVRTVTHSIDPTVDLGGVNDTLEVALPYTLDAGADFDIYVWNGITGNRTFEATRSGWFTLVVTDIYGCTASDSVYISSTTSIADKEGINRNLVVYPNPTRDFLTIKLTINSYKDLYLELLDGLGRKLAVHEYKNANEIFETLDVSGLAKGLYIVKVWTRDEKVYRKILIQ